MKVSMIVALSENNVIGAGNALPWRLSADLKRLKQITMGHHLIMGRKTFESIGKALPGRINVIITRNRNFVAEQCVIVSSLKEAIEISKPDSEIFIFGGGEIFKEALPLAQKIYMTKVHRKVDGDTYFPELKMEEWKLLEQQDFKADEKNDTDYSFLVLDRINHNSH